MEPIRSSKRNLLLTLLIISPFNGYGMTGRYSGIPEVLIPGKHNSTPVTACTGYNPALLTFTSPASGGQPPYSYQWLLNDSAIPGETQTFYDPPQLTASGTFRYSCSITDLSGQVVYTNPKTITIAPDPAVSAGGGGSTCLNTAMSLTSTVTGGTGTFSYQWQSSADNVTFSNIPGATLPTFWPETAAAGILFYRVRLLPNTGSCNDALSGSVSIVVNALPSTSMIYHL